MDSHKASAPYLGFSKDHPVEDAKWRFKQRFGQAPEEVITEGTALLVGPIPDQDVMGRKLNISTAPGSTLSKP